MSLKPPPDSELERLRSENEALHEQVKLLVRAEQSLTRSRGEFRRQLERINALAEHSLEFSRVDSSEQVIAAALDLVQRSLSLNATWAGPFDALDAGPRACVAATERPTILHLTTTTLPQWLPLATLMGTTFVADGVLAVVPLTGIDDAPVAALLAYRAPNTRSFHREPLDEGHLAFLQLVAAHTSSALRTRALTKSLRDRGQELQATVDNLELTQQQLVQSQKMEAVGRLAGGVAHDFNNLLTVIVTHTHLLEESFDGGEPSRDEVAPILDAANQAAEITQHLLAFGRKQQHKPELVDINGFVMSFTRMLGRLIGEEVSLDVRLDPTVLSIRVDRTHLEQILMNLAVNARDAMARRGKLVLETRRATPEDEARCGESFDARDHVTLVVADDGEGMDDATKAQIFEPFFTTKQLGEGTGLGLSIVYGLVGQNHGHIGVESAPGAGTQFFLVFPKAERVWEKAAEPTADARATVLVVEDEDLIRIVLVRVLRGHGLAVFAARTAEEALELVPDGLDLLLTDVKLPGMNGVELATALRKNRPDLPVIYVSGYAFDELDVAEIKQHDGQRFLAKPFTPKQIRNVVDEVLKSGDSGLRVV